MPSKLSVRSVAVRAAVAGLLVVSVAGVAVSFDVHPATADATTGAAIVAEAASQEGIAYCDGGGGINGPTVGGSGSTCAPGVVGYDCMSLAQFAVYQATGFAIDANGNNFPNGPDWTQTTPGVLLPGSPGTTIAYDESYLKPGDVVLFGGATDFGYAHSGIWAGSDQIWDASGTHVQKVSFEALMSTYNNDYEGAVSYLSLPTRTPPTLHISTTSLPKATIGTVYPGAQLAATGGTAPYLWAAKGLPNGLAVGPASGAIKGTVKGSVPGLYTVIVKVTDSSNPLEKFKTTLTLKVKAAA
jgi:cell wall-associated NlpC family hydrolase